MIKQLYPAFQKWAERGTVWLISDPHFDDEDVYKIFSNRPDKWEIINNINSRVGSNDTIIFLGDIGCPEYISFYIRKKAHKVLIMGNHDTKNRSWYENFFDEVYDGPVMIAKNVLLSHEPILLPYIFNIHGHVHDPHYHNAANELNVCIEALDKPYPINLNRMFKRGAFSKMEAKDIHRATIDKATERKKKRVAARG